MRKIIVYEIIKTDKYYDNVISVFRTTDENYAIRYFMDRQESITEVNGNKIVDVSINEQVDKMTVTFELGNGQNMALVIISSELK